MELTYWKAELQARPRRSLFQTAVATSLGTVMIDNYNNNDPEFLRAVAKARMAAMGRTLPLDFSRANGRNRCSPLIDRRHAKVWIPLSQLPLTYLGASRASKSTQTVIRPQCQRSQ